MNTKERLLTYLRHNGINNSTAEKSAELPNGTINNSKGEFNSDTIFKIKKAYEDLNLNWLIAEEEPVTNNTMTIENISDSKNIGNQVGGTNNSQYVGDKSELVEEKEKQINQYENYFMREFHLFKEELSKFHEVQIKKDEYIERIIKSSYDRNKENMERLDELIKQNRILIEHIINNYGN